MATTVIFERGSTRQYPQVDKWHITDEGVLHLFEGNDKTVSASFRAGSWEGVERGVSPRSQGHADVIHTLGDLLADSGHYGPGGAPGEVEVKILYTPKSPQSAKREFQYTL